MSKNILLINDSTSNPNWGDRAAAIALKRMIAESGGKIVGTISEDELNGALYSHESGVDEAAPPSSSLYRLAKLLTPPLVPKVGHKLGTYFGSSNNSSTADWVPATLAEFDSAMHALLNADSGRSTLLSKLKKIAEADVAIIHGDGCIAGNSIIARAEFFLAYVIKRHFKKPVIIINHTADLDHPNLRAIAEKIYPLFDDVVFRDSISAEYCRAFCNGRATADSAFYFEPITPDKWLPVAGRPTYFDVWPDVGDFDPAQPYLCIGGSSLFHYHKDVDTASGFQRLIRHLRDMYTGQLVLTASDLRDEILFRPIARSSDLPLIGLHTPVQQAIDVIGNAEAYIGGRWHPSIFALRGGVPIIPLSSHTFKMQALATMCGLSDQVFDVLNLEAEVSRIGEKLLSYLRQGAELRERIRLWARSQSRDAWDNIAYLKTMDERLQLGAG